MAATVGLPSEAPKTLRKLFEPPQDLCQRCNGRVYPVEKVGNINGVTFHKSCFKCSVCSATLSLRTYYTNQDDTKDKEIYCSKHAPAVTAKGIDGQALGIRANLRAQAQNKALGKLDNTPHVGADALFLKHAVGQQSEFSRRYQMMLDKHHFNPGYVHGKAREKLAKYQQELEKQYREEEDRLMELFLKEREEELQKIDQEAKAEWEVNLSQLMERYEKMGMQPEAKPLTGKRAPGHGNNASGKEMSNVYTDHLEQEKKELQEKMTIRIKEKKSALTIRMQFEEQNKTAEMVKKQSEMMMEKMKQIEEEIREEIKQEIQEEIVIELMNEQDENEVPIDVPIEVIAVEVENAMAAIAPVRELEPPHPPHCRRRDLFDDTDAFERLDDSVVKIAEEEQTTYTDLVYQLTANCYSDLEKVRAIYRWITVKDLNRLEFEDTVGSDTPLGLLRGIKYGTEAYHTLFMRLCSYAGLGCVEIKGHSKSVGYEPGLRIREGTFLNTWNAVQIDGDWWPIQCNWGARHLVLTKENDTPAKASSSKDKIRYQFDDHYFLTDPDEFIQEFWAREPEWQLLERPVTLDEFENMPFVRSVFFHCGLEFMQQMKAVLYTDDKGGADIRLRVPADFDNNLVFHYQLRFADRERRSDTEYHGAKLERFVFHSREDGVAIFSVHVPTQAVYFIEIFANKIEDVGKVVEDGGSSSSLTSFRLKCACKFKIICDKLAGKMHPLPNCATGEWGPSKAIRHFGLTPISHKSAIINVDNDALVVLRLSKHLRFHCKLKMNTVEDQQMLADCVAFDVTKEMLLKIKVTPPQIGQYGLDIYASSDESGDNRTLSHACKYLLNATRVKQTKINGAQGVAAALPPPQGATVDKQQQLDGARSASTTPTKGSPRENNLSPRASTMKEIGATRFFAAIVKSISPDQPNTEIAADKDFTVEMVFIDAQRVKVELMRASGQDMTDHVTVKEDGKKAKLKIRLPIGGQYSLNIFCAKKKDEKAEFLRVFTYLIQVLTDEEYKASKRRSKGKSSAF